MEKEQKPSSRVADIICILVLLICPVVYVFHGSVPSILVLPASLIGLTIALQALGLTGGASSKKNQANIPKTRIGEAFWAAGTLLALGVGFDVIIILSGTDVVPSSCRTWLRGPFAKVEFEFSGCDVVVDSSRDVYALIGLYGRVQKYDWNGRYLTGWFSDLNGGNLRIAIDSNDHIYLKQSHTDILIVYDQDGNLLNEYQGEDQGCWRLGIDGEPFFDSADQEDDDSNVPSVTRPGEKIKFSNEKGFSVPPHETLLFVTQAHLFPSIAIQDSKSEEVKYITPNLITLLLGMPLPLLPVAAPIFLFHGLVITPIRESRRRAKGLCPKCGGCRFKNIGWCIESRKTTLCIARECLDCKDTTMIPCSNELQQTFKRFLIKEFGWDLIDKETKRKRMIAFYQEMGRLFENETEKLVKESDFVDLLSKIDPQEVLKQAESVNVKDFIN